MPIIHCYRMREWGATKTIIKIWVANALRLKNTMQEKQMLLLCGFGSLEYG